MSKRTVVYTTIMTALLAVAVLLLVRNHRSEELTVDGNGRDGAVSGLPPTVSPSPGPADEVEPPATDKPREEQERNNPEPAPETPKPRTQDDKAAPKDAMDPDPDADGKYTGKVYDEESEKPVAGARIELWKGHPADWWTESPKKPVVVLVSEGNGRFEIPRFWEGTDVLGKREEGQTAEDALTEFTSTLVVRAPKFATAYKELHGLFDSIDEEIALSAGHTARGKVTDSTDQAIAGAVVFAAMVDQFEFPSLFKRGMKVPAPFDTARSMEDGRFVLENVDLYNRSLRAIDAQGNFGESYSDAVDEEKGEGIRNIVINRVGSVRLLIHLPSGEIATRAKFLLLRKGKDGFSRHHSFMVERRGKDGIVVPHVKTGEYRVMVWVRGYQPETKDGVTVATGEESAVEFTVRPGLSISGRVVGTDGAPFVAIHLTAAIVARDRSFNPGNLQTKSDKNGAFRFTGLPPGKVRISVDWRGGPFVRRTVMAGDQDVELVLVKNPLLKGRLVVPEGAKMPEWVDLVVEGDKSYQKSRVKPDPKGSFSLLLHWNSLQELPPGAPAGVRRFSVVVVPLGWPPRKMGAFQGSLGSVVDMGEIRRPKGRTLTGSVTGPDGKAVDGARVHLVFEKTFTRFETVAVKGGRYTLRNAPFWEGKVWVDAGPDLPFDSVDVPASGEKLSPLRLQEGGRITGSLLDGEGKPIESWSVHVTRDKPDGSPGSCIGYSSCPQTDPAGRFKTRALPEGTYRLRIFREEYLSDPVEVRNGKIVRVELRMP